MSSNFDRLFSASAPAWVLALPVREAAALEHVAGLKVLSVLGLDDCSANKEMQRIAGLTVKAVIEEAALWHQLSERTDGVREAARSGLLFKIAKRACETAEVGALTTGSLQ